jgi:cell shape-determining protein MreD
MFKLISKILLITTNILYLSILLILPFEWHKFGPYSEIFPAFDLIIIYYLSTHSNIKYWHLFLAGIFVDQIYNLPIGTSPLVFIIAHKGLKLISSWFVLKNYQTNLAIFCVYSLAIILSRYLIVTIKSTHHIEGFAIIFYFLTTIFAYPIVSILIKKPIQILSKYVR